MKLTRTVQCGCPQNVVKFDPQDASYVVCGGADRKLALYNITKPNGFIQYYSGAHGWGEIADAAISPPCAKQKTLASCTTVDKIVAIWDPVTAQVIARLHGHSQRVNTLAYDDVSGSVLASGSYDRSVRLWDLRSKACIQTLNEAKDSVEGVSFLGALIATASVDGFLRVYDVRMAHLSQDIASAQVPLTTCRLMSGGLTTLISCLDSSLILWDNQLGKALANYTCPLGYVNTRIKCVPCTNGPPEAFIFGTSENGNLVSWPTGNPKKSQVFEAAHEKAIRCADGTEHCIATASLDGTINIYSLS